MKKTFSLTNREISENHSDATFHLMLSDFMGAMAYWLIAQESKIDLDIKRPSRIILRVHKPIER